MDGGVPTTFRAQEAFTVLQAPRRTNHRGPETQGSFIPNPSVGLQGRPLPLPPASCHQTETKLPQSRRCGHSQAERLQHAAHARCLCLLIHEMVQGRPACRAQRGLDKRGTGNGPPLWSPVPAVGQARTSPPYNRGQGPETGPCATGSLWAPLRGGPARAGRASLHAVGGRQHDVAAVSGPPTGQTHGTRLLCYFMLFI